MTCATISNNPFYKNGEAVTLGGRRPRPAGLSPTCTAPEGVSGESLHPCYVGGVPVGWRAVREGRPCVSSDKGINLIMWALSS